VVATHEEKEPALAEGPKSYRGPFSASLGAGSRERGRRVRDYGGQDIHG
jgi:hypothetical protein